MISNQSDNITQELTVVRHEYKKRLKIEKGITISLHI